MDRISKTVSTLSKNRKNIFRKWQYSDDRTAREQGQFNIKNNCFHGFVVYISSYGGWNLTFAHFKANGGLKRRDIVCTKDKFIIL